MTILVEFDNCKETYQSDKDEEQLFKICKKMNFPVSFSCRIGACGICKISVLEGLENLSKKSKVEKEFTDSPSERLACQCLVKGRVKLGKCSK